jgi:hypothetical protein
MDQNINNEIFYKTIASDYDFIGYYTKADFSDLQIIQIPSMSGINCATATFVNGRISPTSYSGANQYGIGIYSPDGITTISLGTFVTRYDHNAILYQSGPDSYIINKGVNPIQSSSRQKIIIIDPNYIVYVKSIQYIKGTSYTIVGNGNQKGFIANIDLSVTSGPITATNVTFLNSFDNSISSYISDLYHIDDYNYVVLYTNNNSNKYYLLSLKGYYCGNVPFEITNSLQIVDPAPANNLTINAITTFDGVNASLAGFNYLASTTFPSG